MKWLVKIKFQVIEEGGFLNKIEAMKFIPSYLFKHADESIKPNWFNTLITRWDDGEAKNFYFILSFAKEFDDFSDMILWVDEVERKLQSYFEEHMETFRNAEFRRTEHNTYRQELKKTLFSSKTVWVRV